MIIVIILVVIINDVLAARADLLYVLCCLYSTCLLCAMLMCCMFCIGLCVLCYCYCLMCLFLAVRADSLGGSDGPGEPSARAFGSPGTCRSAHFLRASKGSSPVSIVSPDFDTAGFESVAGQLPNSLEACLISEASSWTCCKPLPFIQWVRLGTGRDGEVPRLTDSGCLVARILSKRIGQWCVCVCVRADGRHPGRSRT